MNEYLSQLIYVPSNETLYFGYQTEIQGMSISNGYLLKRYLEWNNRKKCKNMIY